jgi:hypothetical protein
MGWCKLMTNFTRQFHIIFKKEYLIFFNSIFYQRWLGNYFKRIGMQVLGCDLYNRFSNLKM